MPDHLASDPARLSRFKREAQALASLNHPNIAQIYGLEESGQSRCIVMELVDGETLEERLKRGAIPIEETLRIAGQIAEALEAAHEKGIVHRDLKPANIKIASGGKVKLLDFGLARIFEPEGGNSNLSQSPTLVSATMAGVILGTASYMSPEQARGQTADRTSDNWGFGCVLYEMLTGRQVFTGPTVTDILGGIVKVEPDWSVLPEATPVQIQSLLRRCLQKDRRRRLQYIADARVEIEHVILFPEVVATHTAAGKSSRAGWTIAVTAVIVLLLRPALRNRRRSKSVLSSIRTQGARSGSVTRLCQTIRAD